MKQQNKIIFLVGILCLGIFLRFHGLSQRGLIDHDEGYYHEMVKTLHAGMRYIAGFLTGHSSQETLGAYILQHGGQSRFAGKPMYELLGAFFSFVVGLSDATLPILSSFFGVFTVWVVYGIGRDLWEVKAGLWAGFLLALSWYHILYSRSAYPHVTSVFFMYLALWCLIRFWRAVEEGKRMRFWSWSAGLAAGTAFTCHYNLFWVPCVLAVTFCTRKAGKRLPERFSTFLSFCIAALLPILAWELTTQLIKYFIYSRPHVLEALQGSTGRNQFLPYIVDVLWQMQKGGGATWGNPDPFFYVKSLFIQEGVLFGTMLFLGIALLIQGGVKRKDISFLSPALFVVIPLLLWSAHSHTPSTRTFVAAIPASSLCAAFALTHFQKKTHIFPFALRILLVGLFVELFLTHGISQTQPLFTQRSGFREAVHFMASHQGVKHLSSNVNVSRVYVGRDNALDMDISFGTARDPKGKRDISFSLLREKMREGFSYLLLDPYREDYSNQLVEFARTQKPVFVAAHTSRLDGAKAPFSWRQESGTKEFVEIYALRDLL